MPNHKWLYTTPDGRDFTISARGELEAQEKMMALESELTIPPEIPEGTVEAFSELTLRNVFNNVMSGPKVLGEMAAMGAAGGRTLTDPKTYQDFPSNVGSVYDANVESEMQQWPASALTNYSPLTAGETMSAGNAAYTAAKGAVSGAPQSYGELYDQNLGQDLRRVETTRREHPGAAMAADVAGAVIPVGGVRAGTFAKRKGAQLRDRRATSADKRAAVDAKARDLMPSDHAELDGMFSGRGQWWKSRAKEFGRASGRAGETATESVVYGLLNGEDPDSNQAAKAMMLAGGQYAASVPLYMWEKAIKHPVGAGLTAGLVFMTAMTALQGGWTPTLNEAAFWLSDKNVTAMGLGLGAGILGAGRIRGKNFNIENYPKLADSITTALRGSAITRLNEFLQDPEPTALLTLEKFAMDPEFFNDNQRNALERAMKSKRPDAWHFEVNRLMKDSQDFRMKMHGAADRKGPVGKVVEALQ